MLKPKRSDRERLPCGEVLYHIENIITKPYASATCERGHIVQPKRNGANNNARASSMQATASQVSFRMAISLLASRMLIEASVRVLMSFVLEDSTICILI